MRCARYTFLLNKGEKHWTWVNTVPKGALANGLDDGKVLIGWRQMLILCAVSALSVVHAILNLFVSVFVTSRGTKKRFSQQTTMSSLCTASQRHIVPCDGHTVVSSVPVGVERSVSLVGERTSSERQLMSKVERSCDLSSDLSIE